MKLVHARNRFVALAIITVSVVFSSTAHAVTRTWNKATSGTFSFTDVANWDDGTTSFPNAVDDIAAIDTLDLTGSASITLNQSITLGELRWADTVAASGTSFAPNFNNSGGTGALVFQASSGTAKIKFGHSTATSSQRNSTSINVPVTLNSDTEVILDLQSANSRNLYFSTGALSGSGNLIVNAATRGIVAFFTDTYDLSAYTGTIKYTSNGASGNSMQLAGNNLGAGNLQQTTLEMSVATAGGSVFIFDAQDGAKIELGALRGDGLIQPFTNFNVVYLSGTLKTGYLPGTNTYSGVISPIARFAADSTPATFNYEKMGANSTQIFSGANTYNGTTTVSEGTLLVNGTHTDGGAYSVASGATLGGIGNIGAAQLMVDSGGFLAPGGPSIGTFNVAGTTINGTLAVQYQGASIDMLNVDPASLLDISNATVDFSNLGGTLTAGPHVFATYGAGLLSGTFLSTPGLPSGATIDYGFNGGTQIALIAPTPAGVPGDYNSNGTVDSADYVIWRKNNGTNNQLDNEVSGVTSGQVTIEDYHAWRQRFGNTSGSGSSLGNDAGNVPEPAGLLLLVSAIVGTVASRWRR